MEKLFDQGNIIICPINEDDLMGFLTKLDIDDAGNPIYPYDEICDVVMSALPDYAFAGYAGPINMSNIHRLHKEAARSMYETENYYAINQWYINHNEAFKKEAEDQRAIGRGEFGEILLHALLCDFKGTIPLVSKFFLRIPEVCLRMVLMQYIFVQIARLYGWVRVSFIK